MLILQHIRHSNFSVELFRTVDGDLRLVGLTGIDSWDDLFDSSGQSHEGSEMAGRAAVPSAVQVLAGVHKNTAKRSGMIPIAQQHTQNWVDS